MNEAEKRALKRVTSKQVVQRLGDKPRDPKKRNLRCKKFKSSGRGIQPFTHGRKGSSPFDGGPIIISGYRSKLS